MSQLLPRSVETESNETPGLIGRLINYLWFGPPQLSPVVKLEWRFVALRWLGIALVFGALPLLHLSFARSFAAYAILAVGSAYNLSLHPLLLRRPSLFANGYLPALADSALNLAMLMSVGDGFSSPYASFAFVIIIEVAMRYGYLMSALSAVMIIAVESMWIGLNHAPITASFVFSSGFLCFASVLASYLREQAEHAEGALEQRLQQATLLNEATLLLSGELDLARVVNAIATASSRLFDSRCSIVQLSDSLRSSAGNIGPVIHCSETQDNALRAQLTTLADRYCKEVDQQSDQVNAIARYAMPAFGQTAAVFVLSPPPNNTPLATVALAIPGERSGLLLDDDILESFLQRVTVALENALLYDRQNHLNEALREGEAHLRAVTDNVAEGLITIDSWGHIRSFNVSAEQMYGYRASEVLGQHVANLLPAADFTGRGYLAQTMAGGPVTEADSSASREMSGRRKDETLFPIELAIREMRLDQEQMFIISVHDISERKRSEALLEHLAMYDPLTDLPNRSFLSQRLEGSIAQPARNRSSFALFVMDLDRFKEVNDTFGHHCGDLLLRELAHRLQLALPKSSTLARLGGDEFAVLLPAMDTARSVAIAQKLLEAIDQPMIIEGYTIDVGMSIGIALYPAHGKDSETLVRHADVAMYVAKHNGTGFMVYSAEEDEHSPGRLAMISDLRHAIEQDELMLYYQPKLDLATHRVIGAEALVRWQHPELGVVLPDQFIPLAEHTGLIKPLGLWALGTAIRQTRLWREAGIPLKIAVNLSMHNLLSVDLPGTVARLLAESEVDASQLVLELTESAIMRDPTRTLGVIERLFEMGVDMAIDDFGTGYSSLTYLKRLPVAEVKIDKSFVQDMATDRNDEAIVRASIELGHSVGVKVVAEGVEDRVTFDMLAAYGCDVAQGYYVSRPLPAVQFIRWLQEQRAPRTLQPQVIG